MRSKVIQIRLLPEEMVTIKQLAEQAGLKPSTFVRMKMLEVMRALAKE